MVPYAKYKMKKGGFISVLKGRVSSRRIEKGSRDNYPGVRGSASKSIRVA